jgi:hypothetical protein
LLSIQVALNPQIAPVANGPAQISDKRRIAQIGKFRFVGIRFRHQFARDIKF